MAFSYGFFNSHDGDRTYSAKQFGSIFDGIINDGVFRTIGQKFSVSAGDGMKVKVGSGRGWFCHTWVLNTNDYTVTVPQSEVLLNRVDALVIEIDHRDDYRRSRLTVIKGPAENLQPTWPPASNVKNLFNFWDTDDQKQIPIAYIRVLGKVTQINTVDIFSAVGKVSYGGPAFVTGPLETVDLSTIYTQLEAQWSSVYSSALSQLSQITSLYNSAFADYVKYKNELNALLDYAENLLDQKIRMFGRQFEDFLKESQNKFDSLLELFDQKFRKFMKEHNEGFNDFVELKNKEFNERLEYWGLSFSDFWENFKKGITEYLGEQEYIWETWFRHIHGQLTEEAATNLQRQIDYLSYAYVVGERAILGITAFESGDTAIFGNSTVVEGDTAIITRTEYVPI